MLDRQMVLAKLEELEGYLRELEQVAPASHEAFQDQLASRLAVERLLQVGIECLLDIGELFVRGWRLGLPEEERGLVRRLEANGVLPAEELALLRSMQAFRNVLVHRYGKIDGARVFANMQRAPTDFRRLAAAFREALDRSDP